MKEYFYKGKKVDLLYDDPQENLAVIKFSNGKTKEIPLDEIEVAAKRVEKKVTPNLIPFATEGDTIQFVLMSVIKNLDSVYDLTDLIEEPREIVFHSDNDYTVSLTMKIIPESSKENK